MIPGQRMLVVCEGEGVGSSARDLMSSLFPTANCLLPSSGFSCNTLLGSVIPYQTSVVRSATSALAASQLETTYSMEQPATSQSQAGPACPGEPTDPVQLMLSNQNRLFAFVLSLVGNREQANDVLQQTNLVLWEKLDDYEPGTNFMAWAFQIARYQVMAYRQKQGRDRHVFDDEAVSLVAAAFERQSEAFDERLTALSHCIQQLPDDGRILIKRRYGDGWSVKNLAADLGQTANRLAVRLHRLRATLMECIQRRCAGGEAT